MIFLWVLVSIVGAGTLAAHRVRRFAIGLSSALGLPGNALKAEQTWGDLRIRIAPIPSPRRATITIVVLPFVWLFFSIAIWFFASPVASVLSHRAGQDLVMVHLLVSWAASIAWLSRTTVDVGLHIRGPMAVFVGPRESSGGVRTGDPEFDRMVTLQGPRELVLAHASAEARAALLEFTTSGGVLRKGRVTMSWETSENLALAVLEAEHAMEVARRLVDDRSPADRLWHIASTDPVLEVRLHAAAALFEVFGDSAYTRGVFEQLDDPVLPHLASGGVVALAALMTLQDVGRPSDLAAIRAFADGQEGLMLEVVGTTEARIRARVGGAAAGQLSQAVPHLDGGLTEASVAQGSLSVASRP